MAKRKENLEHLADILCARHIRISVPDGAVRDRLAEVRSEGTYPAQLVERDIHCIAVVGAGASAPLLERGDDLAKKLEIKFGRDEAELDRLKLVNNLKRNALETRLIALSRSPDAARLVRDTISDNYRVRHPTLLGYELLAHLLKHRFLDAIVSFNFDELLDQSLDDELDRGEYTTVVSERDCSDIEADPNAADYVPLYVKLHGTASEPDSLRFTPDSYYSIPQGISRVVQELLHTEHCVIVTIGAGLSSFDFQRLLRIPRELDVFNLSRKTVHPRVSDKIARERKISKQERKLASERARDERYPWLHECNAWKYDCDQLMQALCGTLEQAARKSELPANSSGIASGQLVQFRAVRRHEAVATLLGSDAIHSDWPKTKEWTDKGLLDYARNRTILELAFAGAKARGLLSLVPLVDDRPARYYELYRRRSRRGLSAEDWAALCSAAGLEESAEVPDILLSHESVRAIITPSGPSLTPNKEEQTKFETRSLHEFDPGKLAELVLRRVKNNWTTKSLPFSQRHLRNCRPNPRLSCTCKTIVCAQRPSSDPPRCPPPRRCRPTPGSSSRTYIPMTISMSARRPGTGCYASQCAQC